MQTRPEPVGKANSVLGPSVSTDDAIPVFDNTTGTLLRETNWFIDSNDDQTVDVASDAIFTMMDGSSNPVITFSTSEPTAAGTYRAFRVQTNGANDTSPVARLRAFDVQSFVGGVGVHSRGSRGFNIILTFRNGVSQTGTGGSGTRAGSVGYNWASTGVFEEGIGFNATALVGGGEDLDAGTGQLLAAMRIHAGFQGNAGPGTGSTPKSGEIQRVVGAHVLTPNDVSVAGSHVIHFAEGVTVQNQNVVDVGTSYAFLSEDQLNDGFAFFSGTGANKFGDKTNIDATDEEALLVTQNGDVGDVLTLNTTDLTGGGVQRVLTLRANGDNDIDPTVNVRTLDVKVTLGGVGTNIDGSRGIQSTLVGRDGMSATGTDGESLRGYSGGLAWNSSGELSEGNGMAIGALVGGGNTLNAGNVILFSSFRSRVGYQGSPGAGEGNTPLSGSIDQAAHIDLLSPHDVSAGGSHPISLLQGIRIQNQNVTDVGTSVGIDIEDQTGGGYAMRTGTGNHFLGDKVSIGAEDTMTVNGVAVDTMLAVHHEADSTDSEVELHRHNNTSTAGATLYGARSRGTEATPLVVQANDDLLLFAAVGYDGTDYALSSAISFEVDGTPGTNDMPGRIVFSTAQDGTQAVTEAIRLDSKQNIIASGRIQGKKGADVASADEITLGIDGNYFDITGTTTINHINKTDWQAGSEITLQFDASVTVTHNAASPTGTEASILLEGSIDFNATANDTLTLRYDGVTWREKTRSII